MSAAPPVVSPRQDPAERVRTARSPEPAARSVRDQLVPLLFAATLFVNAALLFGVEPMVAKMILPLLGGAPAVWNTCLVFFQAALLVGYLGAHAVSTRLPPRAQALVYLGMLGLAAVVLPIAMPVRALESVPSAANPLPWLVGVLIVAVGLPFIALSTTAPLLQRWFAGTGHPAARDPYFLYSASNLGSLVGLLGYPLALERYLSLPGQSRYWAAGYGVLGLLAVGCAALTWGRPAAGAESGAAVAAGPVPPLTAGRRFRWLALAFVPSSLLLGVTLFLTTDLAPVPLLWVVPLALYLLSFIVAFARRPILPHAWTARATPVVVVLAIFLLLGGERTVRWEFLPVHLLAFFLVALFCHGELARDRPPAARLTEFYLWLSVGGVAGGLFNSLVVPLLFRHVGLVVEYPLALLAGCALQPTSSRPTFLRRERWLDLGVPLAVAAVAPAFFLFGRAAHQPPSYRAVIVLLAVVTVGCYVLIRRPVRFALTLGAFLVTFFATVEGSRLRFTERNFFGIIRVVDSDDGSYRQLIHGNTVHGMQSLDAARARRPSLYYYPTGPAGQVFAEVNARPDGARVAVIGLGVGSLATYARTGQEWTFYEIDPAVVAVSRDLGWFTYLRDCAVAAPMILGDARLRLRDAPAGAYDLIVLDAFGSDAIPTHLLTREALALYESKLAPGGLLAFNLSNRYLDLRPVVAGLAEDAQPVPMACAGRDDLDLPSAEQEDGKYPSQWVVLARREADLGRLAADPRWRRLRAQKDIPPWTDAYSNLFAVFKW